MWGIHISLAAILEGVHITSTHITSDMCTGIHISRNLVPRASFPLTSGQKTRALGATISGMRHSMK